MTALQWASSSYTKLVQKAWTGKKRYTNIFAFLLLPLLKRIWKKYSTFVASNSETEISFVSLLLECQC